MTHFSGGLWFLCRRLLSSPGPAAVLVLCVLLGLSGQARAVDPGKLLSQYGHTAWRLQDGELPAPAYPMAQTTDGYLWVGTQAGVVRFDGVRFVPLDALTEKRLPGPFVLSLLGARDGSLWIGTTKGLSRWKDGQLVGYPTQQDEVSALSQDQAGKIWLLTRNKPGMPLCEVKGRDVICHGKSDGLEFSDDCCDRMGTDGRGTFWLGAANSVVRWHEGGTSTSFPVEAKIKAGTPGYLILAPESSSDVWVGLPMTGPGLGLQRLTGDEWQSFKTPGIDGSTLSVQAMLRDRHGALWVGTIDHGIYRIASGRMDHFDSKDGLSSDSIYSFFEDREGNMWVTTSAGMDRFRDFRMWSYTTREGIAVDEVDSVAAGRDGKIWIGTASSLDVLDHGQLTSLRSGKELPGTQVASLLEDKQGRLWAGIDKGLWIYDAGKFTAVLDQDGKPPGGLVAAMAEDGEGNIWATVRTKPRKLARIRGDRIVEEFEGPTFPTVSRIASDPRGGVWLGLANGDLARPGAKTERIPMHLEKVPEVVVVADDGLVMIGAETGLAVLKDGISRVLSERNGLPCHAVYGLVQGDGGALWLYMGCGLVRVELADLERTLHDPAHVVGTRVYDVLDGVRPARAPFDKAARAPDGSLWFANGVVLQSFDPHATHEEGGTLPVHVEGLVADRKPYPLSGEVKLPALTRNVQIDYTAIALAIPQRARFRYRLEGRDQDWMDAGSRRQAFYTDLPPGTYNFRVAASMGDGRWQEASSSVGFTVLPAFYQTRWFILLVIAVVVLVLWLLFAWRLAHVKIQMRALFEERHAERERIARELHDTFLQGVQGLMLRFQSAMERIPSSEPARGLMENALDHADEVIAEGRDRVTQLRAQQRNETDLPSALQAMGEGMARDSRVTFRFTVEGMPRNIDPAVGDEVERIAQESLVNAFRHAQATHIDVSLAYARNRLVLSIVDNGRGFDAEKVIANGPEGHWGLKGLHERATNLRAQLTVSSRAGAGTAVELVVPAAIAFRRPPTKWSQRMNLLRMAFARRGASVRPFHHDE